MSKNEEKAASLTCPNI